MTINVTTVGIEAKGTEKYRTFYYLKTSEGFLSEGLLEMRSRYVSSESPFKRRYAEVEGMKGTKGKH